MDFVRKIYVLITFGILGYIFSGFGARGKGQWAMGKGQGGRMKIGGKLFITHA
jgi:hypothetical protein